MTTPTPEEFAEANYGWTLSEFGPAKECLMGMRDMLAREAKAVNNGEATPTTYGYTDKTKAVFIMEHSLHIDDINIVLNACN